MVWASDLMDLVPDDSTPLDPEEAHGLRLSFITTRADLNEAEALNLEQGLLWARSRAGRTDILSERFLRELHQQMFGNVWRWAGKYRRTDKNIGISWWEVPSAVKLLLDDARVWRSMIGSSWSVDELCGHLHHRLVSIHPFPNGNGRHSRAMSDLLAVSLGAHRYSWGRTNLAEDGDVRRRYIAALRRADNNDIGPLIEFMRS